MSIWTLTFAMNGISAREITCVYGREGHIRNNNVPHALGFSWFSTVTEGCYVRDALTFSEVGIARSPLP